MKPQKDILLTTLNARYIHASLGLRYLYANLGELQPCASIIEFTIKTKLDEIVSSLLEYQPKIIGIGVYIWNITESTRLIQAIKQADADIKIIIGGPEVSYEYQDQHIFSLCDHLITGQADLAFAKLCQKLLTEQIAEKITHPLPIKLADLKLPYRYYNAEDIAHRVIYVEASRGCPFKCEFCLSSLDKTAYPFELDKFLAELDQLYQRGARTFKFVDRTFNLKVQSCINILEFFLARLTDDLFLHFELIPDNLPEALKSILPRFPAGTLQFEIGVQTFTESVQNLISRRQNNEKTKANILWLKNNTNAHLHTDLIFGLPGETLASFIQSFNELVQLGPDEIQLGILKRLRGTPIIRHSAEHQMEYSPKAPYTVTSTASLDSITIEQVFHCARFWDRIANSGRFNEALPLMLGQQAFENFLDLSDYLYQRFNRSHSIQLEDLFPAIADYYQTDTQISDALTQDQQRARIKTRHTPKSKSNRRQQQHLHA